MFLLRPGVIKQHKLSDIHWCLHFIMDHRFSVLVTLRVFDALKLFFVYSFSSFVLATNANELHIKSFHSFSSAYCQVFLHVCISYLESYFCNIYLILSVGFHDILFSLLYQEG